MNWYLSAIKAATGFHTCSITELGFIRVSVITGLQPDIAAAKHALAALKGSPNLPFRLIPDDVGVAQLPAFVKKAQSVTDGHLLELAAKNSLQLVTFDAGIPNALFIG